MRYLRGGQVSQQLVSEKDEHRLRKEEKFMNCMEHCKSIKDSDNQYSCMKKCSIDANYEYSGESDGGGRRRYHRRKQSKSRSRKH
jgi:hypothetical protein